MRLSGPVLFMALLLLGRMAAAATAQHYTIDQRYGSVGFSVSELGLFDAKGSFRKFSGELAIDRADPEQSSIDVEIAVGSVVMSSTRAARLVLSPAYFDVQQFPAIRFRSTSVQAMGQGRYLISGLLHIRGVTRPQQLMAVLTREQPAAAGPPTAYFTVSGTLSRSRFGMTANSNFLGDRVHIVIHIHLALPALDHAG
ncbi:MAG: YceI family protein [Acetobacteraceae bacterium]